MAMVIQDVFERLKTLQEVLSKKFECQREIEEIPKILATKTELLNRLRKLFTDKTAATGAKEKQVEELRDKAIEAEHARERSEQAMDHIQTQREYEALDKEIKDAVEKEQELRKSLQREQKLLDEMKVELQKEEQLIQSQEEEVKKEKARIKEELKSHEQKLKSLEKEERKIIPGLDEEVLFKFERIIKSKAGLGIVPIEQGVCTGCHMILSPQFVNDVHKGEGIIFCPNCSRILFYHEIEEEAPEVFFEEEAPEEDEEEVLEEETEEVEEEEEPSEE